MAAERSTERPPNCRICLRNFEGADKKVTTPCDHTFHTHCFFKWMENRRNCPLCRKNFVLGRTGSGVDESAIPRGMMLAELRLLDRTRRRTRQLRLETEQLTQRKERIALEIDGLSDRKGSIQAALVRSLQELASVRMDLRDSQQARRYSRRALQLLSDYRRDWEQLRVPRGQSSRFEVPREIIAILSDYEQ